MKPELQEELVRLLSDLVEGTETDEDQRRLRQLVADDAEAREYYFAFMSVHAHLLWKHGAVTAQRGEPVVRPAKSPSSELRIPRSPFRVSHLLQPMTLVLLVGLFAAGIVVYKFSTQSQPQPVAEKPVGEPAAQVASTTDAQWLGPLHPKDGAIAAGERLVLERGSVEITFSRQARMIIEAPTDVVIVDGGTCRLASGKLTAYVPPQAKGFQVHTPDGTVTDLGTEFGVYVRDQAGGNRLEAVGENEQEQPANAAPQQDGKQAPTTEVHVFRGQVDVSRSEVGGHRGAAVVGKSEIAQDPTSDVRPPTSTILSAGEAVTISEQKVQALPAADPFKFALDKLQGKPRQVLLAEDFETYPLGNQVKAIGPWIVQSGIRKGQGIHVYDPRAKLAEMTADAANPVANLSPAPAIGSRVAFIAASALNPRDTFPLLAHEINGKPLAKNCQVLIEFDYMPLGPGAQFSVALAPEAGHTAGIELWRDVDATKKVAPPGYQWYRLRVLLTVADGVVREVRAERSHWLSSAGWVRDMTFQPPTPKLDWSTPPRYAMFGFPVVSPTTPAGVFWLDNVRIEVISE